MYGWNLKYFNLQRSGGCSTDDFSANGQNWGFPTYNWFEMLKDEVPVVEPPFPEHGKIL